MRKLKKTETAHKHTEGNVKKKKKVTSPQGITLSLCFTNHALSCSCLPALPSLNPPRWEYSQVKWDNRDEPFTHDASDGGASLSVAWSGV